MAVEIFQDALGRFIETAPDAMVVVRPTGEIVLANTRACSMFGVSDLVGTSVDDLLPAAAAAGHAAHRARFHADGMPRQMGAEAELVARRADGSEFPVDVSLGFIDVEGEQLVSAAVRDNTARRAEEDRLARFEVLVSTSGEAIVGCDPDGLVTVWNTAAERLTRLEATEAVGRPLAQCLRADDGAELSALIERALAGELIEHARIHILRTDGRTVPASLTISPLLDPRGRLLGASGVVQDVSEQVEMQEFLADMQQLLVETQGLANIGLWEWDITTDEMQWSEQLFRITGVQPLDFGGTVDACLASVGEGHRETVEQTMRKAARTGSSFALEHPIVTPDGEQRWVFMSGDPVLDERDRVRALRGICQDITERQATLDSLVEADRLKDEFLATVSHELRTPLTVILGFAKLMAANPPEQWNTHVGAIVRNSEEMQVMVERMLDFCRLQSGRARIDPKPCRLGTLIDDLLPLVEAELAAFTFTRDIEEDLGIMADERAFPRIVVNLLTNAAKFTPDGGTITLEASQVGRRCRIVVADNGPGIPDDELELIFERFHQVDGETQTRKRGAGIGLAIVRSYAEAMGGEAWAESTVGEGSRFIVELPLAIGEMSAAVAS